MREKRSPATSPLNNIAAAMAPRKVLSKVNSKVKRVEFVAKAALCKPLDRRRDTAHATTPRKNISPLLPAHQDRGVGDNSIAGEPGWRVLSGIPSRPGRKKFDFLSGQSSR